MTDNEVIYTKLMGGEIESKYFACPNCRRIHVSDAPCGTCGNAEVYKIKKSVYDYTTDAGQGAILRKMEETGRWWEFAGWLAGFYEVTNSGLAIYKWLEEKPAERNKLLSAFLKGE